MSPTKISYGEWLRFKAAVDRLRDRHGWTWTQTSKFLQHDSGWAHSAYTTSRSLVTEADVKALTEEADRLDGEANGAWPDPRLRGERERQRRFLAIHKEASAPPYAMDTERLAVTLGVSEDRLAGLADGEPPSAAELDRMETAWARHLASPDTYTSLGQEARKDAFVATMEALRRKHRWKEIAEAQSHYSNYNSFSAVLSQVKRDKVKVSRKALAAAEEARLNLARGTPAAAPEAEPAPAEKPAPPPEEEAPPKAPAPTPRPGGDARASLDQAVEFLTLAAVALAEAEEMANRPGHPGYLAAVARRGAARVAAALAWLDGS